MCRHSLGDFYAHHHGVTHEPETRVLSLASLVDKGVPCSHLYLASDGVWDLWKFEQVVFPCSTPSIHISSYTSFLHIKYLF